MASEGLGAEETAEDLGVTAHSVGEYLPSEVTRREHLTRASKRRAWARRLAAEGLSPRQAIAAML
jgi:predicted transcriptional regulator